MVVLMPMIIIVMIMISIIMMIKFDDDLAVDFDDDRALMIGDSDSVSSIDASRNTDEHRSPTRANKLASHLMAPVTENHKARLHGGLVHSVITHTSATAASTRPLNSLSDSTSTKKTVRGCLCVVQSG